MPWFHWSLLVHKFVDILKYTVIHDCIFRNLGACMVIYLQYKSLSDLGLLVFRSVICKAHVILRNLDARYDSKSTATIILKIAWLVYLKYSNFCDYIKKYIYHMVG